MLEPLRDPLLLWGLSFVLILLVVAAGIGGFYYRKRRNEERLVRKLVTSSWVWTHRTLEGNLYQKDPISTLESVQGIRINLKGNLERLPEDSKALQPVRKMHEACLRFLTQVGSLPVAGETGLQPGKWAEGGSYRQTLEDALIRLRISLEAGTNQLQEAYGIEMPPPPEPNKDIGSKGSRNF